MTYYQSYKAVFDRVKTLIEGKSAIRKVILGSPPILTDLPLALINPETTTIQQAVFGRTVENHLAFEVVLIVQKTDPADWFDDIISVMGDVVDALMSDQTLNGAANEVVPVFFAPGEVAFSNAIYYGGLVRFEVVFFVY